MNTSGESTTEGLLSAERGEGIVTEGSLNELQLRPWLEIHVAST